MRGDADEGVVTTAPSQILYQNDTRTPLGRLRLAGTITNGRGVVPARPLRVYGSYAVMCLRRGTGAYRDANGVSRPLHKGDAVLVFPELAHWYGPGRSRPGWDEFYITFDGPVFDAWREAGLLDAARPVLHPGADAASTWMERVRALLTRRPTGARERARQVADFVLLLDDLLRTDSTPAERDTLAGDDGETTGPGWLGIARGLLEVELGRDLPLATVAAAVNLSYETFRKRFQEATGTTPARYRMARRIEAAQALLRFTPGVTNREIAETLGFADEFHFSRRFTQATGITPRAFRQRLGNE